VPKCPGGAGVRLKVFRLLLLLLDLGSPRWVSQKSTQPLLGGQSQVPQVLRLHLDAHRWGSSADFLYEGVLCVCACVCVCVCVCVSYAELSRVGIVLCGVGWGDKAVTLDRCECRPVPFKAGATEGQEETRVSR
jgi:hypothetical protein